MFLQRVVLKNYKSIAVCEVNLRQLTILVGPNGSGKSNFLDALRFVADSLRTSLDHALRERGGIKEVRRRSAGHPTHFGIRLQFRLPDGAEGRYSFRIGARQRGGYEVQQEECSIADPTTVSPPTFYHVRNGEVESNIPSPPPAVTDRLYLVNASGLPAFRSVYEHLSRMGFYNLNPDRIRDLQAPDAGDLLARDGRNIASVLGVLASNAPSIKRRIEEYLAKVVPGVSGVDKEVVGPKESLGFRQRVAGSKDPWHFFASSMSDGTLRALGVLVALFQSANGQLPKVPFVGIEEPEVALHPAAAGVLMEGIRDASRNVQIAITSHSPDLLDDDTLDNEALLAVDATEGDTRIAPLDQAGRSALRDRLYTAGELLRLNQLVPDPDAILKTATSEPRLFDDGDD